MGVVYKAQQVSLNRMVAFKMILSGQLATEDDIRRFQIEAEAAANLHHPNIIPIYEVGKQDDQHYFSMEYVDGVNLAQVARDGPLSPKRAARYVQQIAEAIECGHQCGVTHRDIKPSNVLIDSTDQARVTDFGLAKRAEEDRALTATGQPVGTPPYMSPEQIAGRHEKIGPISDVYSLGALFYELLTGRPPFRGKSTLERGHHDIEFQSWSRMLVQFAWIILVAHGLVFAIVQYTLRHELFWLGLVRGAEFAGMGVVL